MSPRQVLRCLLPALLLVMAGCARQTPRPAAGDVPGAAASEDLSLSQDERYSRKHDSAPEDAALQRIAELEEPVPKTEPRARYGNGPVYEVRGKTYHVLDSAAGYHARGLASWYGAKFHGHLTSSLEPYDMYKFTAAHKTLPLPTYARVTNLDNGRSVVVRINDRGPFHGDRLIDLSYAAAVRLGIWKQGTGRVEVDAIVPGEEELPPPPVVSADLDAPRLYLQAGAFADIGNARQLVDRLRGLGLGPVEIVPATVDGKRWQRVWLGPFDTMAAANRANRSLLDHGLSTSHVVTH